MDHCPKCSRTNVEHALHPWTCNDPWHKEKRKCGHAKSFASRCIECELISAREKLAWAKDDFDKYGKLVIKLEAEKRMSEQIS